ncbi:MAG TPA: sulfatase-like hydrolase/transferase [Caulifigura sp.]|nr:sulfatase-like hydrolase/transferase [Caulifigura sp.]
MKSRLLPVIATFVLLAAMAIDSRAADRPPNIVLIVSDDQGYNDLQLHNSEVLTPTLNRLARDGVYLKKFYVAWPACTPSRAAMLTGRFPQRNGVYDMIRNEAPDYGHKYTPAEYEVTFERVGGMDTREIILPAVLKQAGYTSAIYGKWDLGTLKRFLPLQKGFDDFYGFVNTGIDYFTHERYGVPSMYDGNEPTEKDKGTYCTDLFRDHAVSFIKANRDKPFFLYLPFNAPHSASNLDSVIRSAPQGPDEFKAKFPHLADTTIPGKRYGKDAQIASPSKRKLEYVSALASMDAAIGRVLDTLDELKLADNTLVLFFSDNGGGGGSSNKPLRGGKSQMFEGGVRVLALARYPGVIPPGSESSEFLTTLEVFPTLTNLTGAKSPAGVTLDGFDMLPVLLGKQKSTRTEMFWQRQDESAARVGEWKWIRIGEKQMLFNLTADLSEKQDLAQTHPDKVAELRGRFDAWKKEMDAAEPRGPFRDF